LLTSSFVSVNLSARHNLLGVISIDKKRTRRNEAIRAAELRVIDENDEQLGVMTRQAALEKAKLAGLDLVEVSPNAVPPVVKIVDWGKYSYQKTKLQKKNKSKSHDLKQIRMGLKIGEHDLDVKIKKIESFLEAGHMVKVSAFFRGREMAHKDIGYTLLERVMEKLGEEKAVIEQQPQMTGKNLSMTIRKK